MMTLLMIENQDTIAIPVAYLEAFFMMLVAFLIGYIGASMYNKITKKKLLLAHEEEMDRLHTQLAKLKEENERPPEDTFVKDRMDQEYEQVQFQQRAFSQHVLAETVEVDQANVIDFERIGTAEETSKDDLQEIVGIGPYTEAKLNNLGIFTYEQISKFNDEDIELVTALIKFFPDRIKNDRWVAKANDLKFRASQENGEDPDESSKKKVRKNEKTT